MGFGLCLVGPYSARQEKTQNTMHNISISQYEWVNSTVGPKLKSVYWCTWRGYSIGEWGGDEGM